MRTRARPLQQTLLPVCAALGVAVGIPSGPPIRTGVINSITAKPWRERCCYVSILYPAMQSLWYVCAILFEPLQNFPVCLVQTEGTPHR